MDIFIFIFLIIFMLHNLEEIIMVERWMKKTYPRVKHKVPPFMQKELDDFKDITAAQFAIVVFGVSILASILLLISLTNEQYYLFLGISLAFAINIFSHPLQSLLLWCYTPGVITSIFLIIPYYILLFNHLYATDMVNLNMFLGALVVVTLFILVFLFSQKIGKKMRGIL
ncbi:HXXEE domain-containing protein [Virgibacillus dokdonensis]|uniref:HXXEE domain-containing protein n=2 Tax=Virgibacillus TaxID=84406 RepID=A0A3E0WTL9_9BACI|nr:HXXEE domain-containing protein [Virgibacillus dokdonensis]RFA36332.1 HXXEE domain-containing protein [Virgibacillus dokdonensis]